MSINRLSDKIVFGMLKHLKHGVLKITNYDNKKYIFGADHQGLNVTLKINKPGLTKNIISLLNIISH